jgi:hypothetical protein
MTFAATGFGATFALGNGAVPEVFTPLAEVFEITPPSDKPDLIEATHFTSPNGNKEFILGMNDPGECSLQLNYLPGNASDIAIRNWRTSRAAKTCRITWPNGLTWTFAGLITGYAPGLAMDDKMTATVTIKVTGSNVVA